jgi:hypothetical protein
LRIAIKEDLHNAEYRKYYVNPSNITAESIYCYWSTVFNCNSQKKHVNRNRFIEDIFMDWEDNTYINTRLVIHHRKMAISSWVLLQHCRKCTAYLFPSNTMPIFDCCRFGRTQLIHARGVLYRLEATTYGLAQNPTKTHNVFVGKPDMPPAKFTAESSYLY